MSGVAAPPASVAPPVLPPARVSGAPKQKLRAARQTRSQTFQQPPLLCRHLISATHTLFQQTDHSQQGLLCSLAHERPRGHRTDRAWAW